MANPYEDLQRTYQNNIQFAIEVYEHPEKFTEQEIKYANLIIATEKKATLTRFTHDLEHETVELDYGTHKVTIPRHKPKSPAGDIS